MSTDQTREQKLSFAQQMVDQLEEMLMTGAGVASVSVDGTAVTYSRAQALKELEWWRKQVARYSRTKSRTTTINLGNAND